MITIDPLKHYDHMAELDILRACGILIPWSIEYFRAPRASTFTQHMEECYGFGSLISLNGTISTDGTFHFPGDPVQYPLVSLKTNNLTIYFYPHAITAWAENGQPFFITRID